MVVQNTRKKKTEAVKSAPPKKKDDKLKSEAPKEVKEEKKPEDNKLDLDFEDNYEEDWDDNKPAKQ